jgi:hypothetical protein
VRDFWQHLPPGGVRSIALGSLEHAFQLWLADQKYPGLGLDWPCLQGHLEHGSALLMLDNVDEVPPIRKTDDNPWYPREMLLTGLAEAVAIWTKAGNRVLVTGRPYGLNAEQQRKLALQPAPILGLDQELQSLLVRRWFRRLKEDHGLGLETADAMIEHIHVERGLDDPAVNPLLLTAMCIIYDEGKRLPHDKYTLYDRIVDTVLHKRYVGREGIDPIRGRLAVVALGMHTGGSLNRSGQRPARQSRDMVHGDVTKNGRRSQTPSKSDTQLFEGGKSAIKRPSDQKCPIVPLLSQPESGPEDPVIRCPKVRVSDFIGIFCYGIVRATSGKTRPPSRGPVRNHTRRTLHDLSVESS